MTERGVCCQRLKQREIAPKSVERLDRTLSIRHPNMNVQTTDRGHYRVPQQEVNSLVAFLICDVSIAFASRGVRT